MTWQPKKLTREQMAERRAEGVRLLEAGEMTQAEIARHLGVTEAAVSKWKRQLLEHAPHIFSKARKPEQGPIVKDLTTRRSDSYRWRTIFYQARSVA